MVEALLAQMHRTNSTAIDGLLLRGRFIDLADLLKQFLQLAVILGVFTTGLPFSYPILHGQSVVQFVDLHESSGLIHKHSCAGVDEALPRLMAAGLAVFDYDGDELPDILLLNQGVGATDILQLGEKPDAGPSISAEERSFGRLYRNLGFNQFADVTNKAGLTVDAFALGVTAGDIDNDGDVDLVFSCYGPSHLLLNNGDGTFSRQAELILNSDSNGSLRFGAGLSLLDMDNDGALDLFIGNYVEFNRDRYRKSLKTSFPYPPGPKDFPPATDVLYRNLADGRFQDVTAISGIAKFPGPTMGIICGDWDDDGDADIFLCSDAAANQLLVNDSKGNFVDKATESGLAYDLLGNVNGSMGVDAGDFDNDGKIDLLISNYTGQIPVLYRNLGSGLFEDVSRSSQVGRSVLPHTNWGVVWIDIDNDGDLDVFFANGHFLKGIQQIDQRTNFHVANTLMENLGNGKFRDISSLAGHGLSIKESSRGAASADFDADGDMDLVVLNFQSQPSLLINNGLSPERSRQTTRWIDLRLIGTNSNRDAVGAKVKLEYQGKAQSAMVHSGRGYQSHFGSMIHFGLGTIDGSPAEMDVATVTVTWPSGKVERFEISSINQITRLVEGSTSMDNDRSNQ
ncbi:MAG: CRTAC1 family protein [Pirellulales bacterium]